MYTIENMKSGRDYTSIILEEIRDQFKVVIDTVVSLQETVKTLATQDSLNVVANDVKTIKLALIETNKEVRLHDLRITKLEQAV